MLITASYLLSLAWLGAPLAAALLFQHDPILERHPHKLNPLKKDQVIVDSDLVHYDDLAALDTLLRQETEGKDGLGLGVFEVKAVVLSVTSLWSAHMTKYFLETRGRSGAAAAAAAGRGDIPIGLRRPADDFSWVSTPIWEQTFDRVGEFCKAETERAVRQGWARAADYPAEKTKGAARKMYRDSVELLVEQLRKADDHSVTIMGIGFLANLEDLLKHKDGRKLIETKVWRLVLMAGGPYRDGPDAKYGSWPTSYNFYSDQRGLRHGEEVPSRTSKFVVDGWPRSVPVLFVNLPQHGSWPEGSTEAKGIGKEIRERFENKGSTILRRGSGGGADSDSDYSRDPVVASYFRYTAPMLHQGGDDGHELLPVKDAWVARYVADWDGALFATDDEPRQEQQKQQSGLAAQRVQPGRLVMLPERDIVPEFTEEKPRGAWVWRYGLQGEQQRNHYRVKVRKDSSYPAIRDAIEADIIANANDFLDGKGMRRKKRGSRGA